MVRTADYGNAKKFSNRKSFDGKAVEPGKVLVPFRKDTFDLPAGSYIQDNFTPIHFGDFKCEIGFMPIFEECYGSYMKEFRSEINKDFSSLNRVEILPLNFGCGNGEFDIEDTRQPSIEDQVLNAIEPEPTEDELRLQMLAHFDKEKPLYAQIIRLSLSGMSVDDICIIIGLKPSRGRREIDNAHDAVCDYLKLRHHKKKS